MNQGRITPLTLTGHVKHDIVDLLLLYSLPCCHMHKLECAFTNTVLNECAYLCRNSTDWKQLYIKYDACVGDVVDAWTIYSSFYDKVLCV